MRIFVPLLAACVALAALPAARPAAAQPDDSRLHHQDHPESSPILAFYDFEEPTPSGPDTFWARQRDGNKITLSNAFRVSGERSLQISEVPGNRDFAEFLAYFRERDEGRVFLQFHLLLSDPEQRFNFGLAGTGWFLSREMDGQAIWLQTDDGVLRHHTFDGWRQLFAPSDPERAVRMLLKLSDVAHLAGDAERERELRESIYGRLGVEPH